MGRSAYEGVSDGQWAVFAQKVVEERDEARAEVERLRDVVRQVHALAAQGDDLVHGWIDPTLREIHEITKGMVE